jgi:pyruvate/2-oxoglutarate dehydrogenase complex dihydrolipoamide acyltransferase (E2) component
MPTNVIMPQMGESIAEGTLTKWLKKPGDAVKRDEPLFEISTDKVDAEIPSPGAGTLLEILVPEGQTVPINTVVARLAEAGEATSAAAPPAAAPAGDSPKVERTASPVAAPTPAVTSVPAPSQQSSVSPPVPSQQKSPSPSSSAPPQSGESQEELLVSRRPRDRGGEGRRHLSDSRHGRLRPRDEAGHRSVSDWHTTCGGARDRERRFFEGCAGGCPRGSAGPGRTDSARAFSEIS